MERINRKTTHNTYTTHHGKAQWTEWIIIFIIPACRRVLVPPKCKREWKLRQLRHKKGLVCVRMVWCGTCWGWKHYQRLPKVMGGFVCEKKVTLNTDLHSNNRILTKPRIVHSIDGYTCCLFVYLRGWGREQGDHIVWSSMEHRRVLLEHIVRCTGTMRSTG